MRKGRSVLVREDIGGPRIESCFDVFNIDCDSMIIIATTILEGTMSAMQSVSQPGSLLVYVGHLPLIRVEITVLFLLVARRRRVELSL